MAAGVYAITCLVNGWQYIGHAEKLRKRWLLHRLRLREGNHRCKQLQADWNQWGEDNFTWQVLEVVPPDLTNETPLWLHLAFREAEYQDQRFNCRNSHEYNAVEKVSHHAH